MADHPRSRGVYGAPARRRGIREGSSPLARGLRGASPSTGLTRRIIPARAGFTPLRRTRGWPRGDHPRSRGVYPKEAEAAAATTGSSPLARGLRRGVACPRRGWRIIPARAGFTLPRTCTHSRSRDHPRSRGVYGWLVASPLDTLGSSPLARGLRVRVAVQETVVGIIPARAGFTRKQNGVCRGIGDHPRSRGVYSRTASAHSRAAGSSPLARGLRGRSGHPEPVAGIIPARAGFTETSPEREPRPPDHPRSRGVYRGQWLDSWDLTGSSPLARGLRPCGRRPDGPPGIIPARAGFTRRRASRSPASADHPRSRGVYAIRIMALLRNLGSSPLARGLPISSNRSSTLGGIIPARAGFTRLPSRGSVFSRDHPRSRGVYPHLMYMANASMGSSPLARGLRVSSDKDFSKHGIIPARAGFTVTIRHRFLEVWDHPRSRGVYTMHCGAFGAGVGSSPLARGLRRQLLQRRDDQRIIPARAGFTSVAGRSAQAAGDHPRSRGVYAAYSRGVSKSIGSSPLARGLRVLPGFSGFSQGIIPARAGFTQVASVRMNAYTDHPRSRGVYERHPLRRLLRLGSSPLARGLLQVASAAPAQHRIIPARAGFTVWGVVLRRFHGDHPRSRGVYERGLIGLMPATGSSPLARGLPRRDVHHLDDAGIIPARAGFTEFASSLVCVHTDHPRSRGVYVALKSDHGYPRGSSPLARGLQESHPGSVRMPRIIPARAGFTHLPTDACAGRGDHPRSRGVYNPDADKWENVIGSSPLARGLLILEDAGLTQDRIIPARAGFTPRRRAALGAGEDHPRSRGVYNFGKAACQFCEGSSPLARGLRLRILGIPTTSHTTRLRLPSLPT